MVQPTSEEHVGMAENWPVPAATSAAIPSEGVTVDACGVDDIPYVIGEALSHQDMALIDQVVVDLRSQGEPDSESRFCVTVAEFRQPSWPAMPHWFAQHFPAFLESLEAMRAIEGAPLALRIVADRGGLFWAEDLSATDASRLARESRNRGATVLGAH